MLGADWQKQIADVGKIFSYYTQSVLSRKCKICLILTVSVFYSLTEAGTHTFFFLSKLFIDLNPFTPESGLCTNVAAPKGITNILLLWLPERSFYHTAHLLKLTPPAVAQQTSSFKQPAYTNQRNTAYTHTHACTHCHSCAAK